MSCHEVGEWLETFDFGRYKHSFVENNVDGAFLRELTIKVLVELGVSKLGHRLRIIRHARRLFERRLSPRRTAYLERLAHFPC